MFKYDKLDFEDKTMEFLEKLNELGTSITKFKKITFSDGYLMYSWYRMQTRRLLKERKNDTIPDENRMKEIMLFARIEDTIYELKKQEYEQKVNEYIEKIKELKRNIIKFEQITFSDGNLMYSWYMMQKEKLSKERKNGIIPDENHMKEIMLFARIEDAIYELKKQEYEQKINEYIKIVTKIKRNINRNDTFTFSNDNLMYSWYMNESKKLVDERKANIIPTKNRMQEIILFSKIEDELYNIEKKKSEMKKRNYVMKLQNARKKQKNKK